MKTTTDFARLVSSFLTDYLPLQRNCSKNTVLSYKDALKQFVTFITDVKHFKISSFRMKDLNRKLVTEYLDWLRSRGVSASTANLRLTAIKTFCEYAGLEDLDHLAVMQSIGTIKAKKQEVKEISWLSVEQTKKLINFPDANTSSGLRHRVILSLLYDTGCRVSELCDLKTGDIYTGNSPTVHLFGKGQKHRTVVISRTTADLLDHYLKKQRSHSLKDDYLILNRHHQKMTRAGVRYVLNKYVEEIRKEDPSIPERIHPHSLRHSKAVHMLSAGIDLVTIRDFLGHCDISTTQIYAKVENRLKEEAVMKLSPKLVEEEIFSDWTKDQSLMEFLNSFH